MTLTDKDMRYYWDRLQDKPLEGRDRVRAYEAFTSAAEDWVPSALDRFDRLRELHAPKERPVLSRTITLCAVCHDAWPCDTIRIIDGD